MTSRKFGQFLTPPPPSVTPLCPRPCVLVSHFALPPPPPPLCVTSFMNDPQGVCPFGYASHKPKGIKVLEGGGEVLKIALLNS